MSTTLYLDTNIIIDLLGERRPFYESAAQLATLADSGKINIVISALSFTTVFYVLSKFEDKELVKEKIRKLKVITETADLTDKIIEQALSSQFGDFEDAVQYFSALNKDCNLIITRNGKDYKASLLSVLSPDEYLGTLKNQN